MKLPEKKFLSVNEIAERWKVDRSTVLEMMVMGELMPSLFIDNVHCFIGKDMDGSNARAMSGEIYFTPPHSVLTRDSFELNVAIFVCNYVAPPGSYEDAFGSIDDAEDDAPIIAFADPQEFSVYDIRVRRHAFVEATERRYSEAQATAGTEEIDPRERATFLRLIRFLCELQDIDISKHNTAYEVLAAMAATKGLTMPGSKNTIADKLKDAREAE